MVNSIIFGATEDDYFHKSEVILYRMIDFHVAALKTTIKAWLCRDLFDNYDLVQYLLNTYGIFHSFVCIVDTHSRQKSNADRYWRLQTSRGSKLSKVRHSYRTGFYS